MRQRPSARLLVINSEGRILLFRFEVAGDGHSTGTFWATPGGAVDEGETYKEAARRELFEETGFLVEHPGPQVAQRTAVFAMPSGEMVEADERYFLVRIDRHDLSDAHRTPLEREVMTAHRWWGKAELESTKEQVWPENLVAMLINAGVWATAS